MDNTKLEQVKKNKESFIKENNLKKKALLIEATNLCLKGRIKSLELKDEKTEEIFSTDITTDNKRKLNHADKDLLILIFKTVVTDVCKLSPEELDASWCNNLLSTMQLNRIAIKIADEASDTVCKSCLFDRKKIILKEVFLWQ